MTDLVWLNVILALIWIVVWIAALDFNARLLTIYRRDRRKALQAGDPILIIQARGLVRRISRRVAGSGAAILLGGTSLWSRLAGGGTPLTWPALIFSIVFIAAALDTLAQCRTEVQDRAEMERLAALPDPTP